ncbi:MAG: TRAP transporter substrate-binding protein [Thermodesulfobacteriota bacterium]|nr:TRAP transporter substrate-binding protein [Thermodesulfobacteriota bacterium]
MRGKISKVTLVVLVSIVMMFAGETRALSKKVEVIKLTSAYTGKDVRSLLATKFKELAEAKTNGKVEVQLFLAGSLYPQKEEPVALGTGAVQMISTSTYALMRMDPHWTIGVTFGLFKEWKQWDSVWDEAEPILQKRLHKAGIHMLDSFVCSNRVGANINNKRPIRRLEDHKGLKLRTPLAIGTLAKAMGFSPVGISVAEAFTSVQQGVVDGIGLTGLINVKENNFWQICKYCTLYELGMIVSGGLIANYKWWNGLEPELRNTLEEAVIEARDWVRKEYFTIETDSFHFVKEKMGKGLIDLRTEDVEEHKRWGEVLLDASLKGFTKKWTPEFWEIITKYTGAKLP